MTSNSRPAEHRYLFDLAAQDDGAGRDIMTVIDVGARYGLHPSWNAMRQNAGVRFYAFEPDAEEAARLEEKYRGQSNYQVSAIALGDVPGRRTLNLLRHRGLSSLLKPNPESSWFGVHRTGEGEIEGTIDVPISTIDEWTVAHAVRPDFLKVDTEGYDFHVLRGASGRLSSDVLGVRCEVAFQPSFHGAAEFDAVFRLLRDHGFILGNLDYDGRGAFQSHFCPGSRYGMLVGCEAVFIRDPKALSGTTRASFVKYLIFLFLNNLEDLGFKLLDDNSARLEETRLFESEGELVPFFDQLFLRRINALKYVPSDSFATAKALYEKLFRKAFPDHHAFHQSSMLNP